MEGNTGARRFAGKTVAVTGASRGLGRAMAVAFGSEGAFVFVGYRTREGEAGETLAEVRAAGGDGALMQIDVRERDSVQRAFDELIAARGQIDVWVNNAAIASDAPFAMMSDDDFASVIATNLEGVFRCCRTVIRSMIAARSGAIVNVASLSAVRATPGQANYAASKGGLIALTRTLAVEAARHGVRINAVVPGLVNAGMVLRLDRRVSEKYLAEVPMNRFGNAEEVARATLFLASDDASYVTGHALIVDGGLSL